MKIKALFISLLFCFSFSVEHEYYLSTTQVRWVPQKQQLQLTSRFFLEDIEAVMQEKVDAKIQFAPDTNKEAIDTFVEKFYRTNIAVKLDGEVQSLVYLGREYQDDLMVIYAELNPVKKDFRNIEIDAQFLTEFLPTQQNIFHLSTPEKRKSFLLTKDKANLLFFLL